MRAGASERRPFRCPYDHFWVISVVTLTLFPRPGGRETVGRQAGAVSACKRCSFYPLPPLRVGRF